MADCRSLTVRLSREQWASLERLAAKRGISISDLTAEAIVGLIKEDRRYSLARARALSRLSNPAA